jgi:hypothetical protein
MSEDQIGISKQEEQPSGCDEDQCCRENDAGATFLRHRRTITPPEPAATKLTD